jgi:hypothetical protein
MAWFRRLATLAALAIVVLGVDARTVRAQRAPTSTQARTLL